MPHLNRLRLPLAAVGITTIAALAGTAGAAAPPPCGGKPLATDKAGDQVLQPDGPLLGVTPAEKGPDNADIIAAWLAYDGKQTTTNIQVTKLDKTLPSQTDSQGGLYWYTSFYVGDTIRYVYAHNETTTGLTFGYGTYVDGAYLDDGETTGEFTEGSNGIVTVVIPDDVAKPGTKLTNLNFMVDGIAGGNDHVTGLNNRIDSAPDASTTPSDATKFTFTVAPCTSAAPTPGPTPAPGAPTPTPTPAPGAGTSGGGSGGSGTAPAPTTLPVQFQGVIGKASKAKKKKSLKFGAKAGQEITGLKLTLKKLGGKGATLATGKAAKLPAGKVVKVSIKLKKTLKKGTYTLLATGTSGGKKLSTGQKVQIR